MENYNFLDNNIYKPCECKGKKNCRYCYYNEDTDCVLCRMSLDSCDCKTRDVEEDINQEIMMPNSYYSYCRFCEDSLRFCKRRCLIKRAIYSKKFYFDKNNMEWFAKFNCNYVIHSPENPIIIGVMDNNNLIDITDDDADYFECENIKYQKYLITKSANKK